MQKYLVKMERILRAKDGTPITSTFEKVVTAGNTIDAEHTCEMMMVGWQIKTCEESIK